jgi:prophage regulatory protein
MLQKVFRLPELLTLTGLSRSVVYAKMAESPPSFPTPITISKRAVGWIEDDIVAWQKARIAERPASRKTAAETVHRNLGRLKRAI